MSSSAFEKTYEKYCVDLYQKEMEIYTMKQELINLQEIFQAQNSEYSLQYIFDLEFKIAVIWEKIRKISKQITLIETSSLMLKTRFCVANNFY